MKESPVRKRWIYPISISIHKNKTNTNINNNNNKYKSTNPNITITEYLPNQNIKFGNKIFIS